MATEVTNRVWIVNVYDQNEGEQLEDLDFGAPDQSITPRSRLYQISSGFLKKILSHISDNFSNKIGPLVIAMILGMTFMSSIITCWPQHSLILLPDYWYDFLPTSFVVYGYFALLMIVRARLLFSKQELPIVKSCLRFLSVYIIGNTIQLVSLHYIWIKYFGLQMPIPHFFSISSILIYVTSMPLATWVMFPQRLKNKGNPTRHQIMLYFLLMILRVFQGILYNVIPNTPFVKNENMQWTLIMIFPALKKINAWWNLKFILWAFNVDRETAVLETAITVGCVQSFSLTIILGSANINEWTVLMLMLGDTLLNGWSVKNIIRLHQQGIDAANQQRDLSLKRVALKEFLEFLVPSVYCLTFIVAYFGPNYYIIGGMGSDIWHHEKLGSLRQKLEKILIFMGLEVLRGITFAVLLRKLFRLNLPEAFALVMRKYGWYLFWYGIYTNSAVSDK